MNTKKTKANQQPCRETTNFGKLETIKQKFIQTKLEAEEAISKLKKDGSPYLDEFEKELHNFDRNYQVLIEVMEEKPSFCERLINELDDSIKYFTDHPLKQAQSK